MRAEVNRRTKRKAGSSVWDAAGGFHPRATQSVEYLPKCFPGQPRCSFNADCLVFLGMRVFPEESAKTAFFPLSLAWR